MKISKDNELIIEKDSPPDYLVPRRIKQINLSEALKQLSETRVWYIWENSQLYILEPPKVQIMPLSISPEGFTPTGALIVSVEGDLYTGYKDIAKAIFGGYHKDMLPELSAYLRDNFDIREIVLQKTKRIKGQQVPVYRWRGYDLTGVSNLRKKMFWLTDDDIQSLQEMVQEHKVSLTEKRSEQLIRLFDISKEDGDYILTNPEDQKEEISFNSKKGVIEYIRGHKLGGSVSRETAKQMFQMIEGEVSWE